jgi:aminomethyltransferase
MKTMADRAYRASALHAAHRALGARFADDGDWRVPETYTSAEEEATRARAGVGLADTSAVGKLVLRGDGADTLVAKVSGAPAPAVGAASRLGINGATVLACRLAADELLVLTALTDVDAVIEVLARASAGCAHATDLTSGLTMMDAVGPRTPALLARLSPLDLAAVPPLGVVQGELARVHATLLRLDRPAGPAFRVLVAREHGAFVWEELIAAGHDLGLVPIGVVARRRLEQDAS